MYCSAWLQVAGSYIHIHIHVIGRYLNNVVGTAISQLTKWHESHSFIQSIPFRTILALTRRCFFCSPISAELAQQFQFGAIINSVLARLQGAVDDSVGGVSEAVSKVSVHVDCVCACLLSIPPLLLCISPLLPLQLLLSLTALLIHLDDWPELHWEVVK